MELRQQESTVFVAMILGKAGGRFSLDEVRW